MYDTNSMGTRYTREQLDKAIDQTIDFEKEMLPQTLYEYERVIATMIAPAKNLETILALFQNKSAWVKSFVVAQGYNASCYYPCSIGKELQCSIMRMKCQQAYQAGSEYYYVKAVKQIPRLQRVVDRNKKMIDTNNKPVNKIDKITGEIASSFFEANQPPHADDAGITSMVVYGYNKRNDPRYPSVVVYASGHLKTLFPQWFDDGFHIRDICAQGTTSYRDVNDQIDAQGENKFFSSLSRFGRWVKIPDDACYED